MPLIFVALIRKKVTIMPMEKTTLVHYEKIDQVARITLNRPEKYNSLTGPLSLQLQAALDRCREEEAGVRTVYLTGAGKAFCAGQDLQEVTGKDAPGFRTVLGRHLHPIVTRIRGLELPVVCGVNGVAAGAGANIALACDITVAAESASFIQAFSKIGLIPDTGGTYLLPRLIGRQRAAALMMLGEQISAGDAAAMGMIYKSIPDEQFEEEAFGLAKRLSQMPTRGLALTKRALNQSFQNDFEQQLAVEEELQGMAGNTHDYREGVRAFLEKRKPVFKGK